MKPVFNPEKTTSYHFQVVTGPDLVRTSAALLIQLTLRDGIHGNPWACQEVRDLAQVLAYFQGHHDKFNVDLYELAQIEKPKRVELKEQAP